jgi:DNA-directed RNA polymerase subunit K
MSNVGAFAVPGGGPGAWSSRPGTPEPDSTSAVHFLFSGVLCTKYIYHDSQFGIHRSVFKFKGDQLVKEKYTRFERARIVGARSLQIAMGAPVLVEDDGRLDPLDVAIEELKAGVIPITVKRKIH